MKIDEMKITIFDEKRNCVVICLQTKHNLLNTDVKEPISKTVPEWRRLRAAIFSDSLSVEMWMTPVFAFLKTYSIQVLRFYILVLFCICDPFWS